MTLFFMLMFSWRYVVIAVKKQNKKTCHHEKITDEERGKRNASMQQFVNEKTTLVVHRKCSF